MLARCTIFAGRADFRIRLALMRRRSLRFSASAHRHTFTGPTRKERDQAKHDEWEDEFHGCAFQIPQASKATNSSPINASGKTIQPTILAVRGLINSIPASAAMACW